MSWGFNHPLGLLGRILGILALTVVLEFAVGTFLHERSSHLSLQEDDARRLAEHLIISRTFLTEAPQEDRKHLAILLTTHRYEIRWTPRLVAPSKLAPELDRMRRQIIAWEPTLSEGDLRLRLDSPGRRSRVSGALRLPDGSWLYFAMFDVATQWDLALGRVGLTLIPVIAVLAVGGIMVRRTLRPLRQLADATEKIGHGEEVLIPESGTEDIRHLIQAFNAMQQRIHQLIEDRTQMLAAVGHDLRTPIARLQLRLDTIVDAELTKAVGKDIAEMTAMIDSLLAYLAGDKDMERPEASDLAVMCATITDEFRDQNKKVTYDGPDHLEWAMRPLSMRRALCNLIENALEYGGSAHLSIEELDRSVIIRVDDNGPGILEENLDRVLQPFVRLDEARGRNTKGLGLGLAVVAKAVERERGRLHLRNRSGGGLRVEIELGRSKP